MEDSVEFMENNSQIIRQSKKQEERYRKIKVLGEGSMGKVYLVQCNEDKKFYVMKRINIGHLQQPEKQQAMREAQLHSIVSHQNIIQFKQIYHTTKDKLCIIMEYAEGGDLDQLIKNLQGKHLSQQKILKFFSQICMGLRQIHLKKIVHRDLKGANIFIGEDDKIKIGDFGISKVLDKTVLASKSFVGTPYYLSPEMVQGKPYSTKADVWALGVILYHLCALKLPFQANSLPVLALKILKGSFPQISGTNYSRDLKNLISSMLQVDQRKRPSINEILMKPILSKYLPKQLTIQLTPKPKAKVQINGQKLKLATVKSKKQIKIQGQKQLKEQSKQQREQQKLKRQQKQRQMREDLKKKRKELENDAQKQQQLIQKKLQINTMKVQKTPFLLEKAKKQNKKVPSQTKIESQKQLVPRPPIQKPWKNKQIKNDKQSEPQIKIFLPEDRPKLPKQQQINQKGKDIKVQIYVSGKNPYKQTTKLQKPKEQQKLKEVSETQSEQISENIQRDENIEDILKNVKNANMLVQNLTNPYTEIQLYEESQTFDNTQHFDNKKMDLKISQSQQDTQNMKYITNTQSLEQLRQILQDRLGIQNFIKAHSIIKQHFQKYSRSTSQDQSQDKQKQNYLFNRQMLREKLNFIDESQFNRNIQLLYTISMMEDLDLMNNLSFDEQDQDQNVSNQNDI